VFNLGVGEIAVILIVALLFVGPKMLPEIASGLGKIIREIRKATADIRQDIELDDIIRKPLQELRDAATLPPEELKRRDEVKAAQRKAEKAEKAEIDSRRQQAAREEEQHKQREAEQAKGSANLPQAREGAAAADAAKAGSRPVGGPKAVDVITAGGTMILNPPPAGMVETMTPLADILTPEPVKTTTPPPRLPPPPPPPPRLPGRPAPVPADATMIDLGAQAKAAAAAASPKAPGAPASIATKTLQTRLGIGKPGSKKG
jgi:TatA/E family protein of Tat protein translocase